MSVEYPDLSDYLAVAAAVTGSEPSTLLASTKLDLADSALHAPAGSWDDEDFYPDFIDKAAVLPVRLAKNHPLLDGKKRAAWVTLRLFIEMNRWTWGRYPEVDESERAVLAVAERTEALGHGLQCGRIFPMRRGWCSSNMIQRGLSTITSPQWGAAHPATFQG